MEGSPPIVVFGVHIDGRKRDAAGREDGVHWLDLARADGQVQGGAAQPTQNKTDRTSLNWRVPRNMLGNGQNLQKCKDARTGKTYKNRKNTALLTPAIAQI